MDILSRLLTLYGQAQWFFNSLFDVEKGFF